MPGFLLRPKWIAFHLLVVGAVVVMVNLGFWQLQRLDDRKEFNATVTERIEQPPTALTSVLDGPTFQPGTSEWLRITASGTFLPDQIVVFNRSQNGRAGDDVLTPFALDDGRIVLVNRGFVPLGAEVPTPPEGQVEILGRVRPSQERGRGGLTDAGDGAVTEIRRVDIARIAPQLPGPVVPIYVDLIASEPAIGAADPAPVPPPELSEGNHLSYVFQWFIFSICVLIGWVLAVRHSLQSNRRRLAATAGGPVTPDEATEPANADSPRSDAAESTTVPR